MNVFSKAARHVRNHFFSLLLFQIPLVILELVLHRYEDQLTAEPNFWTRLLWVTPLWILFFVFFYLTLGGTTHLLLADKGAKVPFSQKIPGMALAGVVVGILVLIGMNALIIPGMIVLGLYLFVPCFLAASPSPALLVAMRKSWQLSLKHFGHLLLIVLLFGLFVVASLMLNSLSGQFIDDSSPAYFGIQVVDLIFGTFVMLFFQVVTATLFLQWNEA